MEFTKVKLGGDVAYDIHYTHRFEIFRYGSDENPPDKAREALKELGKIASELSTLNFIDVRVITFHRDRNQVLIKMECSAPAQNSQEMKITLPKVGYSVRHVEVDGTGEIKEQIVPTAGFSMDGVEAIGNLIQGLEEYVLRGGSQLSLNFEQSA